MRAHYDFSRMKARRNPYARLLKRSVTIRLDEDIVAYFKDLAERTGLPYQNLINLYLRECAIERKAPSLRWTAGGVVKGRRPVRGGPSHARAGG